MTNKYILPVVLAAFSLTASASSLREIAVSSQPGALSSIAPGAAEDLLLHATSDGSVYLYVEQYGGSMLSKFDVTDPARIRLVGQTETGAHSVFHFVAPLGDRAEWISFGEQGSTAILNLAGAHPVVLPTSVPAGSVELADGNSYLLRSSFAPELAETPSTYSLYSMDRAVPTLLATVPGVTHSAYRSETGTLFLLSGSGVTEVRRFSQERRYAEEQTMERGN